MGKLLAPNGKPSNLTPEQYKLVRTPAFKKWFGDWENDPANASKVVDSNGEPIVVYHGTYLYSEKWNTLKAGTFFTDNKNTAKEYPIHGYKYYQSFAEIIDELGEYTLKYIKENFDVDESKGIMYSEDAENVWDDFDFDKIYIYECFLNFRNPEIYYNAHKLDMTAYTSQHAHQPLIQDGYDSLIGIYPFTWFSEDIIKYNKGIIGDYQKETHYVPFYPEQIKLADGSNTTFDGNNPDIRFDGGGEIEESFRVRAYREGTGRSVGRWIGKEHKSINNAIDEANKEMLRQKKSIIYGESVDIVLYKSGKPIETIWTYNNAESGGDAGEFLFKKKYEKYFPNATKIFKDGGEADEDEDDYYDLNYLTNFIYYNKKELSYLQNKRLILSPNEITEFKPSTHTKRFNDKPNGLWYAVGLEWFDFLKSNLSWESKYHYLYEINITDKVIRIDNMKDAISFSQKYGKYGKDMWGKKRCIEIDWRKVSKDWSGIEIINPRPMMDKQKEEHRLNPTEKPLDLAWMYSWDISSGCVWNNDGVIGIDLLIDFKNNKPKSVMDIHFNIGSNTQPRDLTQIENYRNIYKGAEFYTFSDNPEKVEKADRWFELFRTNQKERQLTAEEYVEFMQLSNELSWEEFSNGGSVEWDAERYRQVEREMYELRQQGKVDTLEYFKLIKERSILEQSKLKNPQNKDMETGHSDIETTYAKGGKIISYKNEAGKFKRIGIEDKYTIEAINEIGLQGINFDEKTITKRVSAQFEYLLTNYAQFVISEDSDAITYDMKNEIERKREEGASLETIIELESNITNENVRQKRIDEIAKGQKESLFVWVDYLRQSEYSVAFKCVMLNAVLKFNFDLKLNKLFERDSKTIRNFTPFDAGILAQLYQMDSDYLLMDYAMLMNEQSQLVLNSREVIDESGNGKWIKFNGGLNTPEKLREENARELSKLVQNTYWCTKSNAKYQLDGGDFYVYVTENGGEIFPRIAVRMNLDLVGEVRGNRSSGQDLEDEMLPIAEDFLIKNIPNDSGVKWLNSIRFNTQCVELRKRIESEGFFKDFIYDYIKVIGEAERYNTDYGENGNLQLLKSVVKVGINNLPNEYFKRGDITDDISNFNSKTKFYLGDLDSYEIQKLTQNFGMSNDLTTWSLLGVSGKLDASSLVNLGSVKVIGTNLICGSSIDNLGNVTYVGGRLDISNNVLITSLGNIEHIGGSLTINKIDFGKEDGDKRKKSNITDLGKLKVINGHLELWKVEETFNVGDVEHIKGNLIIGSGSGNIDLKNIKRIDGSLLIGDCEITDIKNIEHIGSQFSIAKSKIKVFEKLKFIGGDADFSNNFATSTQNIETILGNIKFLNSRVMDFPKLKKVGGDLDMKGSYFKSLSNIKYVGGNVDFSLSKIEDLGDLQYIGGFANFKSSKITTLKNVKKIVKFVNFEGSDVLDLGSLETIGGNAYFSNSKVQSLGNLKYIGGFAQFHRREDIEKEWLERSKK